MSWIIVRADRAFMPEDPKMRFEGDVLQATYQEVSLFDSKESAEETIREWKELMFEELEVWAVEVETPPAKLRFVSDVKNLLGRVSESH